MSLVFKILKNQRNKISCISTSRKVYLCLCLCQFFCGKDLTTTTRKLSWPVNRALADFLSSLRSWRDGKFCSAVHISVSLVNSWTLQLLLYGAFAGLAKHNGVLWRSFVDKKVGQRRDAKSPLKWGREAWTADLGWFGLGAWGSTEAWCDHVNGEKNSRKRLLEDPGRYSRVRFKMVKI